MKKIYNNAWINVLKLNLYVNRNNAEPASVKFENYRYFHSLNREEISFVELDSIGKLYN